MARKNRSASLLDDVLERRLLLYALAAGATIAAVPAAQAKVVFTPSHAVFGSHRMNPLEIDLNHDGVADFTLGIGYIGTCTSDGRFCDPVLEMRGAQASNLVARGGRFQAALTKGETIGSGVYFSPFGSMAGVGSSSGGAGFGYWANVTDRFLGVRFLINGQVHYGWIGFRNVKIDYGIRADLSGWAYETVPNKPIVAGDRGQDEDAAAMRLAEPTSLGLLAMGHTGITDRQRRIAMQAA